MRSSSRRCTSRARDAVNSLTARVRACTDMAEGLREGWDAERARRWYDTSSEIVQTRRRSSRPSRPAGRAPASTLVTTCARQTSTGWVRAHGRDRPQDPVAGLRHRRTLVDAADEAEAQPVPPSCSRAVWPAARGDRSGCGPLRALRSEEDQTQVEQHIARPSPRSTSSAWRCARPPSTTRTRGPPTAPDPRRAAARTRAQCQEGGGRRPDGQRPHTAAVAGPPAPDQGGPGADDVVGPEPQDPPIERAGRAGVKD